jgi:hypothetical protein
MKKIFVIALLGFVFSASGCSWMVLPPGYAEQPPSYKSDFRALSSDGCVISAKVEENYDATNGTADYWAAIVNSHLVKDSNYKFVKGEAFYCDEGPGKWALYEKTSQGADYLYLVAVVVDGDEFYVIEAGGEKTAFEKDVEKVIEALKSFD